jgi:hypothetical protein
VSNTAAARAVLPTDKHNRLRIEAMFDIRFSARRLNPDMVNARLAKLNRRA